YLRVVSRPPVEEPGPGRLDPNFVWPRHPRAVCPSGSYSSPATAAEARFRGDMWMRPALGPTMDQDKARWARQENPVAQAKFWRSEHLAAAPVQPVIAIHKPGYRLTPK